MRERFPADPFDQGLRRIERAGDLALARFHERFKGFAEHLRIDGCLRPCTPVLVGCEPVPFQYIAEQRADRFIGEFRACALLQGSRCEEATVQERDPAERFCPGCTAVDWSVRSPEEEWA